MNVPRLVALMFAASSLITLLTSCGSTPVSLDYQPSRGESTPGPRRVAIGRFADHRNMGEYVLGNVRTPIGTPLEQLTTKVPVSEVVRNAFAHGLSARKMLASQGGAPFILTGEIIEFYSDQVVRPGAYAKIRVNIVRASTGQIVFSRVYQSERSGSAYLPGTGSPIPALRELASRALQDAVDRSLDDAVLRSRLANPAQSNPYGPNVL